MRCTFPSRLTRSAHRASVRGRSCTCSTSGATPPRSLLLDEPAAGLDAQETSRLADLLRAVRERFHVSMLLVDHDMSLVMRVCDYVYVLDFGKLLARGRPDEIRTDPKVIAAYLGV